MRPLNATAYGEALSVGYSCRLLDRHQDRRCTGRRWLRCSGLPCLTPSVLVVDSFHALTLLGLDLLWPAPGAYHQTRENGSPLHRVLGGAYHISEKSDPGRTDLLPPRNYGSSHSTSTKMHSPEHSSAVSIVASSCPAGTEAKVSGLHRVVGPRLRRRRRGHRSP